MVKRRTSCPLLILLNDFLAVRSFQVPLQTRQNKSEPEKCSMKASPAKRERGSRVINDQFAGRYTLGCADEPVGKLTYWDVRTVGRLVVHLVK